MELGEDIPRKQDSFQGLEFEKDRGHLRKIESQNIWSCNCSRCSYLLFSEEIPYFYTLVYLLSQFSSPGISLSQVIPYQHIIILIVFHGPYW